MYVQLGILAVACATAFAVGDRLATGRYESRLADVAAAITEAQNAAVERHNQQLEAERKRADAAVAARSQRRQVAQRVEHEIARDADRGCEWRDLHRLRIEQLYAAYGFNPAGSTSGMQAALPATPADEPSERDMGSLGLRLGSGLRPASQ